MPGNNSAAISQIKPASVLPGSPIIVMGKNLSGNLIGIKIDEKELGSEFFVLLDDQTFKVLIPDYVQAGTRKLSIYIDGTELSKCFEVLPR